LAEEAIMNAMARAILVTAAFLERSDDLSVNEDDAVRALESIAAELEAATPQERAALREAARQLAKASSGPEKTFYATFMSAMGLEAPQARKASTSGKPTPRKKPSPGDQRALHRLLQWDGKDDPEPVRRLIEANPKLVNVRLDAGGNRALHLASLYGFRQIVKLLLDAGADVRAKSRHGDTALHDAILNNHKPVAELLIAAGADLTARGSNKETPLALAVERNRKAIAELLRKHGAKE
jgi:hypothetical protein